MATDATGAPTPLGIPKYNTSADAPSGLGFNAAMDAIDALLAAKIAKPVGIATGETVTWNGSAFVRSSVTKIENASLANPLAAPPWGHPVFQPSGLAALVLNTAYLIPVYVPGPMTVSTFNFRIGVQSGNMDVGIYDSSFNKLWSRGSIAVPVAGSAQALISAGSPTTLVLTGGLYYLVVDIDNGTATITTLIHQMPSTSVGVVLTKAQALPLPASLAGASVLGPGNTVAWASIA